MLRDTSCSVHQSLALDGYGFKKRLLINLEKLSYNKQINKTTKPKTEIKIKAQFKNKIQNI